MDGAGAVEVLFSDWHGLLTWTPIVAVALVGWCRLRGSTARSRRDDPFPGLSWYVNAAVADWWAGEAFGSRRFVSCFPGVRSRSGGVDRLVGSVAPEAAVVSAVIVVHTGLLFVQYQAFMHGLRDIAPYPRGAYNLWLARFVVPVDLLREWLGR